MNSIERLAVVPASVHAWQWACYDAEMASSSAKKEEYSEFTEGGSSSSGYSPEYLAASPAAQRVLQAGIVLQRSLQSE